MPVPPRPAAPRARSPQVGGAEGIVNGMDLEEWDPSVDKYLTLNYDEASVHAGKAAAKALLQAELGLEVDPSVPLFGYIGRLEEQKGVDILLQALPQIAAGGGVQVAILGTGKAKYEAAVKALSKVRRGGGWPGGRAADWIGGRQARTPVSRASRASATLLALRLSKHRAPPRWNMPSVLLAPHPTHPTAAPTPAPAASRREGRREVQRAPRAPHHRRRRLHPGALPL
jgi:glycosyltransferase involved in cell wall biosynthesis